jgi:hypothetical protein
MGDRWLAILAMVMLAGSASLSVGQSPTSSGPGTTRAAGELEPRVLRQATFNIPFSVDTTRNPLEVQLFVSNDAGQTWTLFERQKPTARYFQFRATRDGPVWFASRTIESGRAPLGIEGRTPELYVVVDTTQPELSFTATAGAAGDVLTTWRVTDATLDLTTLKIEYQASPHDEWVPIAFERAADPGPAAFLQDDASLSGEFTWLPQTSARELTLRAEVSDRAGNKTVVTRKLVLNRSNGELVRGMPSAAATPISSATQGTDPPAGETIGSGAFSPGSGPSRTGVSNELIRGFSASSQGVAWPADDQLPPAAAALVSQGQTSRSNALATSSGLATTQSAGNSSPALPAATQPTNANSIASMAGQPPTAVGERAMTPVAAQLNERDAAAFSTPGYPAGLSDLANGNQAASSVTGPVGLPGPATVAAGPSPGPGAAAGVGAVSASDASANPLSRFYGLPPGERPRMTRSKRFQLDYEVDAVAANGVRDVELWGTSDDGRSWTIWQNDADRQSPLDIEVQNDGVYGFRIVIVGNNGLAGTAPRNGDLADLWVGVDTTPPQIDLTAATYGQGEFAGQLEIRWTAQDRWLGDRPVTLLFSAQPGGPWTTIAAGLPNSGLYYWPIDPRIPEQVYLRLEIRDEAGNVAFEQFRDPISISGLTPKARIRAVRPLDNARRQPFRNPFVR